MAIGAFRKRGLRSDMAEFARWESFYGIVGSAAGALIGLQFVVLTLIAERPIRSAEAGATYSTPTIIHFCTALLLSALLRAPWDTIIFVAAIWGAIGFIGAAYSMNVARRMRRQNGYRPVFEDWLFHAVIPFVAHVVLAASAVVASTHTREALFAVGGASLLFLFIGIHNSWDAVSYHVFFARPKEDNQRQDAGKER